MTQLIDISPLEHRRDAIREWLEETAPYARFEQRHLEQNTPERAYWHLGYQAALADALELITNCQNPAYTVDTTNSYPVDEQDEENSPEA
ncbi:MAG: hypothetical protein RIC14_08855 [Filomicrobium sp.]